MADKVIFELRWWIEANYITDEFGDIIYNPFLYITPNELYVFKKLGGAMRLIQSRRDKNELIELIACGK